MFSDFGSTNQNKMSNAFVAFNDLEFPGDLKVILTLLFSS